MVYTVSFSVLYLGCLPPFKVEKDQKKRESGGGDDGSQQRAGSSTPFREGESVGRKQGFRVQGMLGVSIARETYVADENC